jgi:hypothetical protein
MTSMTNLLTAAHDPYPAEPQCATHAYLREWYFSGRIVGVFPPLVMEFSQIHSRRKLLHCRIALNGDLLSHTIKRLLPPFPPRMTGHANSACPVRKEFRSADVFC